MIDLKKSFQIDIDVLKRSFYCINRSNGQRSELQTPMTHDDAIARCVEFDGVIDTRLLKMAHSSIPLALLTHFASFPQLFMSTLPVTTERSKRTTHLAMHSTRLTVIIVCVF